jgi:tight adherence protein C
MLLALIVGGVFAVTVAVVLALTAPSDTPADRLTRYVQAGRRGSPGVTAETMTANERLVSPALQWVLERAASTAPQRVRKSIAAELAMAGSGMTPTMFLGIRGVLMFGLPAVCGLYILAVGEPGPVQWGAFAMAIMWGRRVPNMWLKRRKKARQKAIDKSLPYALDLMVACLEGGLSLDGALDKVAEQSDGPLAAEIRKTLQEITLGRPAGEAMRDLGERNGAPELKRFTDNIVQSERMGISIADSLRTLARDSRIRRRQAAEEMARKAPIKMVPVLIFCVLPALGVVVMTPAAILLVHTLSQATPK